MIIPVLSMVFLIRRLVNQLVLVADINLSALGE